MKNQSAKKQAALPFQIHGPFVEQHFGLSDGRLGVTVAMFPSIDLQEDQRSAFNTRCFFMPQADEAFSYVAEACGQELLDSLDPKADMLMLLASEDDDRGVLFLIRNARNPRSVPEEIASEGVC